MSMSPLSFYCTDCDFAASSMKGWGIYQYADGIDLYYIDRDFGWCEDCQSIVSMEILPSKEALRNMLQQRLALESKLEYARKVQTAQTHWLVSLLKLSPKPTSEIKELNRALQDVREQMTTLMTLLHKMKQRQSGAKCLDCGSERISKLPSFIAPMQTDIEDRSKAIAIMPHPNCTGTICVTHPEIRFMMKTKTRLYDFEANLIDIRHE